MTDSEYNLDPNCLSRCSTELFSEASWEQVDKQDTEVSSQAEITQAGKERKSQTMAVIVCSLHVRFRNNS